MKRILFTSVVCLLSVLLHAQYVLDYLKAANNYFQKGDYASAAEYYEKYVNVNTAAGYRGGAVVVDFADLRAFEPGDSRAG